MTGPSSNRESNPHILLVSAVSPLSSPFTISRGYCGPIRYQGAPSGAPTPDPHGVNIAMTSIVLIEIYLGLLELSMPFIHKQSRFVRDSGSMSATVGGCSLGVKTIKHIGLTHVIAWIFCQLNIAMSSRAVIEIYLGLLEFSMLFKH